MQRYLVGQKLHNSSNGQSDNGDDAEDAAGVIGDLTAAAREPLGDSTCCDTESDCTYNIDDRSDGDSVATDLAEVLSDVSEDEDFLGELAAQHAMLESENLGHLRGVSHAYRTRLQARRRL